MADSGIGGDGTTVTLVVPPSGVVPTPTPPGAPVVVVSPRPHLPFTGLDVSTALILTALLLAIGALLIVSGRKPTPHFRRT
jgi:hypothetical protein